MATFQLKHSDGGVYNVEADTPELAQQAFDHAFGGDNQPPPGVMVNEANRSYITGSPNLTVNTTGMSQEDRATAAAALALRQRLIGGLAPGESGPAAQQTASGRFAPYIPRSPEAAIPAYQGFTQSLGDELLSAGYGLGQKFQGGSFGDAYNVAQEAQRQALAQQRQQDPVGSGLLQAGGALAASPLLAPVLDAGSGLSLPWQIAGGGLAGGLLGGTEGFGAGSGLSDRLGGAATGGATGVAVGGGIPAVTGAGRGALEYLSDLFAGPGTKAMNIVGKDLRSDVTAGGPSPLDIYNKMLSAPSEVLPVDVAGENVRARAGEVARTIGPGRTQIKDTLDTRDTQAPKVLSQAVDATVAGTPGQSTFLAQRMLDQQAQADASPLYGKAYMQPPLDPSHLADGGELNALMQRDSMKKATASAMRIAREQGVDPNSLGITFNEAGDPSFQGVPSWRTLDYMKRGMDDVVGGLREPITGKLDTYGRSADDTRRQFLAFLDANNPQYAPARAAWSGPQGSKEALDEGSRIFTKHPDEIAYDLSQLSPTDQQFYRLGAANKLKTDLGATTSGGNEALKLVGNQNRQDQLTAAFPNAGPLLDIANTEKLKFGTRQDVLGGSQTAGRVAQDTPSSGGIQNLAEGALGYLTGGVAGKSVGSAVKDFFSRSGMTPDVANEIAGRLLQSDPTLARVWLQNAFERNRNPWRPLY